jgi:hypothetical protein
MKKLIQWFLNTDINKFYMYSGLIIGLGLIFSSFFDFKTTPDDLISIDGKIKRIYNQQKERLFYDRFHRNEMRVLLELYEYNTIFILGEKSNKFSAEKFNYGALDDGRISLHVKKRDLGKIHKKSDYKPYSAFTKSMVLLPLDKTLIERNSTGDERLIGGMVFLILAIVLYFLNP